MASLNSHTQTGCTELDNVTAKHSFLKSPELKAMTFSHLQELLLENYDENDQRYRCLLYAALTCKDFLDVALDALWEELDSMLPLLKLLPGLQFATGSDSEDNDTYVLSGNVSQADWDRLQYYSRKVKLFMFVGADHEIHPSTYIRIAQLLQSSSLFPSLRHVDQSYGGGDITPIFLFLSPPLESLVLNDINGFENTIVGPFLATLSSQMLRRIALRNGRMSADILKNSIAHFKQLRSLELIDVVLMSDFALWEVLGSLPALADLDLRAIDPASHPAHATENSNSQSGGPKYFEALESLCVTGSFFLIQHLLDIIDSPCLTTIKVYPLINHVLNHEPDNYFTSSMTIIASKWSQSLKNLVIHSYPSATMTARRYTISKCMMLLLMDLHEMQTFHLFWKMENMDDDVRRLVMSWPKLRSLSLPIAQTSISLSTLKIIAENCPELRYLGIPLNASTIPPFDTSSKGLRHNLEVLTLRKAHPSTTTQATLECQIQVTRYLDFIFPYLKEIEVLYEDVIWSGIRDLVKLCQDARRVIK